MLQLYSCSFSSHKEGIELPMGFHSSPFTYQSEPNKAQGKLLDSEDIKMAGWHTSSKKEGRNKHRW